MSNDTISRWLGECRHEGGRKCTKCGQRVLRFPTVSALNKDYENDESAWTQELYRKIEEAGLRDKFVDQFIFLTGESDDTLINDFLFMWLSLKSSPAQKAEALARAIKEESCGK